MFFKGSILFLFSVITLNAQAKLTGAETYRKTAMDRPRIAQRPQFIENIISFLKKNKQSQQSLHLDHFGYETYFSSHVVLRTFSVEETTIYLVANVETYIDNHVDTYTLTLNFIAPLKQVFSDGVTTLLNKVGPSQRLEGNPGPLIQKILNSTHVQQIATLATESLIQELPELNISRRDMPAELITSTSLVDIDKEMDLGVGANAEIRIPIDEKISKQQLAIIKKALSEAVENFGGCNKHMSL